LFCYTKENVFPFSLVTLWSGHLSRDKGRTGGLGSTTLVPNAALQFCFPDWHPLHPAQMPPHTSAWPSCPSSLPLTIFQMILLPPLHGDHKLSARSASIFLSPSLCIHLQFHSHISPSCLCSRPHPPTASN
jgi:hypothetical protein